MSVILDALKRVQDENRHRGVEPGPEAEPPRSAAQPANALLRRLAEPVGGRQETGFRSLSPVVWVSLAVLAVVAIVALALWMLQPDVGAPRANDGRPLLSDLTGSGGSAPGAPALSTAIQEDFGGPGGGDSDTLLGAITARENEGYGVAEAAEPVPGAQQGGRDMSDLSTGLPTAEVEATVPPLEAADEPSDSVLDLQVRERSPTPASRPEPADTRASEQDSRLDIRSARPGEAFAGAQELPVQQPWQPPTTGDSPAPAAEIADVRVPAPLVDPGVRAAFADGVRLQKAGDFGAAEEAYKRALKFDPHNARVNANLGVLYESQNRLAQAERHLRMAVAKEPDNAAAHNNLGVVLYRSGNYDGALIEFDRTLALNPRHLDAYTNKGLLYTRWGQHQAAERSFLQVLAIAPDDALAHYNLGMVYEEMGDLERAVDHYYDFLTLGGSQHPEIAAYLDRHLSWLEQRLQ